MANFRWIHLTFKHPSLSISWLIHGHAEHSVFQGKETQRPRSHLELIQTCSFPSRRALHLHNCNLKQLQWVLTFRSTKKKSGERRPHFDCAIPSSPTCPMFFWLSIFFENGWVLFDLTSIPQSGHAVFAQTHTNAQTSCFGAIPVCKQRSERSIRIHLGSSLNLVLAEGSLRKWTLSLSVRET